MRKARTHHRDTENAEKNWIRGKAWVGPGMVEGRDGACEAWARSGTLAKIAKDAEKGENQDKRRGQG